MTAFQTSFFSFLSLVFAIYSGNTMAFLYDVRQLSPACSWLPAPACLLAEACFCVCSGKRRW